MATGILCSAGAQILLKHGAGITAWPELLSLTRAWPLAVAALLYVIAFGVYFYLLSVLELTVAAPVMVAGVMVVVFIAGLLMGEHVNAARLLGAALLIAGSFLIVRSSA